ncbi:hypothetical protein BCR32DRAFT_325704 [Anaeromyces robustus]|uniref:Uncharacterized protein n=1 Tax=Anaeromyces robustus TaxID=1754192 RepID=A0A1Y1XGK8_9FUNG|nr:hypothetical protein BCR32DRAFT_325704 [Anaeromyces robustus]|eukprot:ORX84867.1 hypothetical protein BCR32DRAFT_325704 [Anaeromyces robustus]
MKLNFKLALLVVGLLITASSAPIKNTVTPSPDVNNIPDFIKHKVHSHGAARIENDMAHASNIRITPRGKGND